MRTIDADHEAIIGPGRGDRRVDLKVEIEDGDGTFQDMRTFKGKDWILGVEWGENIDTDCMTATVELIREQYNDSLSPLHQTSRTNLNAGGTYDRLIDLRRRIKISTRYAPADPNAEALAWMLMFDGYVDIIDWATETLKITARDKYSTLQDTFIESRTEYSISAGTAIQTVIQDILDDWIAVPPTLLVPVSPGWNIKNFNAQLQSVADQITGLVDQIGWRCRYKWYEAGSEFRLTLYEPDRAKVTNDRDFTSDEYYDIPQIEVSTKDIRNVVVIKYPDPADLREDGTPKRKSVTRTDTTSSTAYGRRWMLIAEDGSSHIDTLAEAQDFADIILTDLAYPLVSKRVSMPYFAFTELDDLYLFESNDIHYTDNLSFAVVGYRHRISDGECTTELDLHEETVVGKHTSWFMLDGGPGMGLTPDLNDPIPVSGLSCTDTHVGILATWEFTDTGTNESYNSSKRRNELVYEIYVTDVGGTPDASDLVGTTRSNSFHISTSDTGIPVGTPVDVHVRCVSPNGASSYSVSSNRTPQPIGSAALAPESFGDGVSTTFNEQTNGTLYPPDGTDMDVGTWGTDAEMHDGSTNLDTSPSGNYFLLLN